MDVIVALNALATRKEIVALGAVQQANFASINKELTKIRNRVAMLELEGPLVGPAGPPGPRGAVTATRLVTGSETLTKDDGFITVDASAGPVVLTLPAVSNNAGIILEIKKIDTTSNTVTLDPNGLELIDDDLLVIMTLHLEEITIRTDASQWWIV